HHRVCLERGAPGSMDPPAGAVALQRAGVLGDDLQGRPVLLARGLEPVEQVAAVLGPGAERAACLAGQAQPVGEGAGVAGVEPHAVGGNVEQMVWTGAAVGDAAAAELGAVEQRDFGAARQQLQGSGHPGEPGADDGDAHAVLSSRWGTAGPAAPRGTQPALPGQSSGTSSRATMLMILISGLIAGPAVSL